MSTDPGDGLTDDELQSEIELVGDLVVGASSSSGPLPQDEIDRLLGLTPAVADADLPEPSSGTPDETPDETGETVGDAVTEPPVTESERA